MSLVHVTITKSTVYNSKTNSRARHEATSSYHHSRPQKKNRKKTNRQKRGTEERQNLPQNTIVLARPGPCTTRPPRPLLTPVRGIAQRGETKNTKQKKEDENGMYGITRVVFLAPPLPLCLQHAKTAMGNSSPTAAFPLPVRAWTMIENTQNCQYTRCTTISSYRYL